MVFLFVYLLITGISNDRHSEVFANIGRIYEVHICYKRGKVNKSYDKPHERQEAYNAEEKSKYPDPAKENGGLQSMKLDIPIIIS